jgi:hypothetical protein
VNPYFACTQTPFRMRTTLLQLVIAEGVALPTDKRFFAAVRGLVWPHQSLCVAAMVALPFAMLAVAAHGAHPRIPLGYSKSGGSIRSTMATPPRVRPRIFGTAITSTIRGYGYSVACGHCHTGSIDGAVATITDESLTRVVPRRRRQVSGR